jgi:hypothetical protein
VKYRADILALYGDLFDEAHTSIEKHAFAQEIMGAGVGLRELARRVSSAGSRLFRRGGRAAATPAVTPHVTAAPAVTSGYEQALQNFRQHVAIAQPSTAAAASAAPAAAAPAAAEAAAKSAKKGTGLGTLAAVGIPAAGVGGYMLGAPDKAKTEGERQRTRNVAFGAGAATGLAAPYVIRGLGSLANGLGGQGLYPGMMPGVGY